MKRSKEYSNKGFTYLECLVATAIIGICALILTVSFRSKDAYQRNTEHHTRAISALTSEADLIRARIVPLSIGKHSFVHTEKLLRGLPNAKAFYVVKPIASASNLLSVQLSVSWNDRRKLRERNLEIYVRKE